MRLRIPGPTPVPKRVLDALGRPMVYHRSAEFKKYFQETTDLLRPLFGTQDLTPIMLSSSGTGALEAALSNVVGRGDTVICLDNGHWSSRFGDIARRLGVTVEIISSSWGDGADVEALRRRLAETSSQPVVAVLAVHNDTFSGAVSDLFEIGKVVTGTNALLVVDAVSSLGSMPVEADAWGLDVVVSASQKGLMCPPGLAFLTVSDKAWHHVARRQEPTTTYFNLKRAHELAIVGQTPFTPAIGLIFGLNEALTMIHEVGIPQTYARHTILNRALIAGAAELGFSLYPSAHVASTSVGVLRTPPGVEPDQLLKTMRDRFGTIIAGARNSPIAGQVIRISTMGYCTPEDVRLDIRELAMALEGSLPGLDEEAAIAAVEKALSADSVASR